MQTRCPNCHETMDVVDDDPLAEIDCAFCGSSFCLATGRTETYGAGKTRIVGRFELLEELGKGAFGSVWKALDEELGRLVAVKLPRQGHLEEIEAERFLREARAAAQLKHPQIVTIHEVGREEDQLYIVSDFIPGATLRDWQEAKPFTVRQAAALIADIADALHHAHRKGIIHRDLKPANILMDEQGKPHLTDFGLARRETDEVTITMEGQILGTPSYMSPEQARGEGHRMDGRGDIYSLGVILFELLTGERPFRGSSRMIMVQILRDEPPSLRKLKGEVPRDLETITLKCLAKDPKRRYATAGELSADLRRFLAGKPILARPVGRLERLWRWCGRNRALATLIATVATLLVVVAAGSTITAIRMNELAGQERDARSETERILDLALVAIDEMLSSIAEEPFNSDGNYSLSLANVPEMEFVRKQLLVKARTLYGQLLQIRPAEPRLRRKVARAHHRLGDIETLLGEYDAAAREYDQSIEILTDLADQYPQEPLYRHYLAISHGFRAELLRRTDGEPEEAEKHYRKAIDLQRKLLDGDPQNRSYRREWTRSWNNYGLLLASLSRNEEASSAFAKSIAGLDSLQREFPSAPSYRADLARSYLNDGMLKAKMKLMQPAQSSYGHAIDILQVLHKKYPLRRTYQFKLAVAQNNLGNLFLNGGQPAKSEPHYTAANDLLRNLKRNFPRTPLYYIELANSHNSLGVMYALTKRPRRAMQSLQSAVELFGEVSRQFPNVVRSEPICQHRWGVVLGVLAYLTFQQRGMVVMKGAGPAAELLLREHVGRQALHHVEEAIRHQRLAVQARPGEYRRFLVGHYEFLAIILNEIEGRESADQRLHLAQQQGEIPQADVVRIRKTLGGGSGKE